MYQISHYFCYFIHNFTLRQILLRYSKRTRDWYLTHKGWERNIYRILNWKPELMVQFGRITLRWENNIKMLLLKKFNLRLRDGYYYFVMSSRFWSLFRDRLYPLNMFVTFLSTSRYRQGQYFEVGLDRSIAHPFQFIIYESSYNSVLLKSIYWK
jgi:hypothetical protein